MCRNKRNPQERKKRRKDGRTRKKIKKKRI
jgi:hypothetical protein